MQRHRKQSLKMHFGFHSWIQGMATQSGGLTDSFKFWEQQAEAKRALIGYDQQSGLDVHLQV